MDIHDDIRVFFEILVWICYGFSNQGSPREEERCKRHVRDRSQTIPDRGEWGVSKKKHCARTQGGGGG